MAQDYKVSQFKKGDFQDQNGNYWCDMALEGVGEPVRIVVKDPMQFHDGMTLYGRIEEVTSKAGKPYNRFYREKKEDAPQQTFSSTPESKPDGEYWDDKNAQIRAQWAIGQAVALQVPQGLKMPHYDELEVSAKLLFEMVDRVKGSSESTNPKAILSVATQQTQPTSGYDKFKESRPQPKTDEEIDADSESLYKSITEAEKIPMDQIPF